jgi:phosphatidylglycerol:prolipoprotein diacylglycerol transferase
MSFLASTFLAIPFPDLDPVAFRIGPVAVRWYGLAYLVGLVGGWLLIKRMLATPRLWGGRPAPFEPERTDDLLLFMTIGVVVGGRLGEVLFYELGYFLQNPARILAIWEGGMSFHGGLVGAIAAILFFAHRNGVEPRSALDLCAAVTPLGVLFGRIANFINGELWGRATSVPWGVIFPHPEAGPVPRHPSQLYEAAFEGAILLAVLMWLVYRRDALTRPGLVAGVFMAGYAIGRSLCEPFRDQDWSHPFAVGWLTPGIVYSLPMLAIGLYLVMTARRARPA